MHFLYIYREKDTDCFNVDKTVLILVLWRELQSEFNFAKTKIKAQKKAFSEKKPLKYSSISTPAFLWTCCYSRIEEGRGYVAGPDNLFQKRSNVIN